MTARLTEIRAGFRRLKTDTHLRQREIAAELGISEGELLSARLGSEVTRLTLDWHALLPALNRLGTVMALTRNHACVHEKIGVYCQARLEGQIGLVLGADIDLRAFLHHWTHGFALEEETRGARQSSLQFFDGAGTALHKIFLRPESDHAGYADLVCDFTSQEQSPEWVPAACAVAVPPRPDSTIDVPGLRAAWGALRDTHDFSALLRRFSVERLQGLRLAGSAFARPVALDSVTRMLQSAAASQLHIMVFTGNRGMLQIHSGPVSHLSLAGPWLNIMDPGFNLHLRYDLIASAWVVHKPTDDGAVSSLELFDVEGESIAWFFGARKPGLPEQAAWRELLATLVAGGERCAS